MNQDRLVGIVVDAHKIETWSRYATPSGSTLRNANPASLVDSPVCVILNFRSICLFLSLHALRYPTFPSCDLPRPSLFPLFHPLTLLSTFLTDLDTRTFIHLVS